MSKKLLMTNIILLILFLLFTSPVFAFVNVAFDSAGNAGRDIWIDSQNGYIYLPNNNNGLYAYSFDGSTFTKLADINDGGFAVDVWDDGTYIYLANDLDGLRAYTFDGTSFSNAGYINDMVGGVAHSVWGDGTYIYLGAHSQGLFAYSFDGSTFTQLDTVDPGTVNGVWGDGTYVYAACTNSIRAYTFNGSNFILKAAASIPDGGKDVWGDGTYIYLASTNASGTAGYLRAYTFNGTSFTKAGETSQYGAAGMDVWGDGAYIFFANNVDGLRAFTFDGTTFHQKGHIDDGGEAYGVMGDGSYIYLANWGDGIRAYTFYSSVSSTIGPWIDGGSITISGSGFGTKATETPAVFDNFDSNDSGRQSGDAIKNNNCSHYGQWEDYSNDYIPIYTNSNQRTGSTLSSYHHMTYDTSQNHAPIIIEYSPTHNGTVLLDFWTRFTQSGVTDEPAGSKNLKLFRIHSNEYDWATNNNTVNMSWDDTYYIQKDADPKTGQFKFLHITGDPATYQDWPATGDSSLNHTLATDGSWNHITVFQKAGSDGAPDGSSIIWVDGNKLEDTNSMITWETGDIWAAATFGWYVGNVLSGNYYMQCDDIYIDTYWQSVWIGDNSDWNSCTHREIQIPTAWATNQIAITVNQGSFPSQSWVYLFVVDQKGAVSPGKMVWIGTPEITSTVANGAVGSSYYSLLTGNGNGLTWEISSGSLPPGSPDLELDENTGAITGIPTTEGSYDFTVKATDSGGQFVTKPYTIIIGAALGTEADVQDAIQGTIVHVSTSDGLIASLQGFDPSSLNPPSGYDFGYGIFGFQIVDLPSAGASATVTFDFATPIDDDARWYWYNASTALWSDITNDVNMTISGTEVQVTLKDNTASITGVGDSDSVEKQITDPSGPAVPSSTPTPTVITTTDGGSGGGCFIATAAFGSGMDRHVQILSEFRDKRLAGNYLGQRFIALYNKYSPPIADFLRRHTYARTLVRYSLIPITAMVYLVIAIHPAILLLCFILLLVARGYYVRRSAIKKQRSTIRR